MFDILEVGVAEFNEPAKKDPATNTEAALSVHDLAENIGKLVLAFLGLAYLCGFLILYTFFFRMGIHDLNTDLLRIRYVHTGLLCLAFPLFLLIPVLTHVWMSLQGRKYTVTSALTCILVGILQPIHALRWVFNKIGSSVKRCLHSCMSAPTQIWIYLRQCRHSDLFAQHQESTTSLDEASKKPEAEVRAGRSRLSYTVQLMCLGICLYTFLLFEPYGAFHERLKRIALLLAVAVLPGSLFRSHLGFAAKKEHTVLRWAVALVNISTLIWVFWPTKSSTPFTQLWLAVIKGAAYWAMIGALLLYLFQTVMAKRHSRFPGQVQGLYIARTATVITLILISTLAFAYRLFPLIPADKGGGNYSYRRDARVCVAPTEQTRPAVNTSTLPTDRTNPPKKSPALSTDPTKSAKSSYPFLTAPSKSDPITSMLPEALVDGMAAAGCSAPVKVIETTDSTLYVARSNDRGGAPPDDLRSAPEIWTDGAFVPTIYAIAKSKVFLVEYNLQTPSRVSPTSP